MKLAIRRVISVVASSAIAATGFVAVAASPAMAAPQTIGYTGVPYVYVVPNGVTSLTITVDGAEGASVTNGAGGKGARITGSLAVTPGEALQINVGGAGGFLKPGWNGGGPTTGGLSYGGGGATDIRRGACAWAAGCPLSARILVAGGGGAAGAAPAAGGNGGASGSNGANGSAGQGGQGATPSAGGAGGTGTASGTAGQLGVGGGTGGPAGSGGGGLYGGGGGAGIEGNGPSAGAGGGGSSLAPAGTSVTGTGSGNGSVQFSEASAGFAGQLTYTGSPSTYTVTPGVTKVRVQMWGAGGGAYSQASGRGGRGGAVDTPLAVTGGEILEVRVGGRGGDEGAAGWNGGGTGGIGQSYGQAAGGGGGGTDIRRCSTPGSCDPVDIITAAGGGGGGTWQRDGGAGGGAEGGGGSGVDGGGGTQNAGGAAGISTETDDATSGTAGAPGQGGTGGRGAKDPNDMFPNNGGGGGGGGYYGGGGGGGGNVMGGQWESGTGAGGSGFTPLGGEQTVGGGSADGGWVFIANYLNPPTSLAGVGDDTTVSLNWTAPVALPETGELTGYRMQRTTTPGDENSWVDTTVQPVGTATTMTETGLTNGTEYSFRVVAINGAGDSDPSNVAAATPFDGPPAPTGVGVTQSAVDELTVNWTAASPVPNQGYKVYVSTSPTGPFTTEVTAGTCTAVTSGSATSCTVTGLTPGTTYYFALASVDTSVTGGPSTAASGVPIQAPDAATMGSPTRGNLSITVPWTNPTATDAKPRTSIVMQWNPNNTGWVDVPTGTGGDCDGTLADSATTCTVSGLTEGDTYQFRAVAVNAVGQTPATSTATVTVIAAPNPPTAVTPAVTGPQNVSVAWTPPTSGPTPTSYVVYRSTDGTNYTAVTAGGCAPTVTATLCVDTDVTAGTLYTYKVSAVNSELEGDQSAASVPVVAINPPEAPVINTTVTKQDEALTVSWTASTGTTAQPVRGYKLLMSTDSGPFVAVTGAQGCNPPMANSVSSCQVTGLTAGSSYQFKLVAINAAGDSPASDATTAEVAVKAPDAPTVGTPVVATGTGQISIPWTAAQTVPAATSFVVYRAESATGPWVAITSGSCDEPTASPCVDTGTPGTTYYYQVAGVDGGVEGPASAAAGPITAIQPPGAATMGTPSRGNLSITVPWTNFTATGAQPVTNVKMQWQINGTGGYVDVPAGACSGLLAPSTATCTFTGLTDGDTYSFQVVTINAAGQAVATPTADVTVVVAPNPPTAPTADVSGPSQVAVTWVAPTTGSTPDGYVVYRSTDGTNYQAVTTGTCASPITALTCVDTNVTPGTAYTYKIASVASSVEGDPSTVAGPVTAINAPATATMGTPTRGNLSVTVPWTNPTATTATPLTNVKLQWNVNGGGFVDVPAGFGACNGLLSPSTATCEVTGLTDGSTYAFQVVTINSADEATATPTAAVTAVSAPLAPTVGTPVTSPGTGQISVPWTPAGSGTTATSYVVYRSTSPSGPFTAITTGPCANTTASPCIDTATPGTTYYYQVAGVANAIEGDESAASTGITAIEPPDAATMGTPTRGNLSITVPWTNPSVTAGQPLVNVKLQWRVNGTGGFVDVPSGACSGLLSPSTESCTVTGLTAGDGYEFQVVTINAAGEETASPSESVEAIATPDAPVIDSVTVNGNSLVVKVTPGAGGVTDEIVVTAAPGYTCTITPPEDTCTISSLPSGAYNVTAVGVNGGGSSPVSAPVSATIGTASVTVEFVDLPDQFVVGQSYVLNLEVSGSVRSQRSGLTTRSLQGVNGEATIGINGTPACTATITNGRGSCRATITSSGKLKFTAVFEGEVAGTSGTVSASAVGRASASAATVAISKATLSVVGCRVNLRVDGRDAVANRTVKVLMKRGSKWVTLGKTKSKSNLKWLFKKKRVNAFTVKLRATDGKSTTATYVVKVKGKRALMQPRAC